MPGSKATWLRPGETALIAVDPAWRNLCIGIFAWHAAKETFRVIAYRFVDLATDCIKGEYECTAAGAVRTSAVMSADRIPRNGNQPGLATIDIYQNLGHVLGEWEALSSLPGAPVYIEQQVDMVKARLPVLFALSKSVVAAIAAMDRARDYPARQFRMVAKKAGVDRGKARSKAADDLDHKRESIRCMIETVGTMGDTLAGAYLHKLNAGKHKLDDHADTYNMALQRARLGA